MSGLRHVSMNFVELPHAGRIKSNVVTTENLNNPRTIALPPY
jgi:hypothetical protein